MSDCRIRDYERSYPLIRALREIELAGIFVNTALIDIELGVDHPVAQKQTLRSMKSLQKDGFVTSLVTHQGGKTGRFRVESGFNSMGIPHGVCRDAIVSRHPGGSIWAFDYNAIDYRCIIAAITDEKLKSHYNGAADFHERTMRFIFPESSDKDEIRRKVIKLISYVYIYGGHEDALEKSTGLSIDRIRQILAELDKHIYSVKKFREDLWTEYKRVGVSLPHGELAARDAATHPGQLLGLYAQSYSSKVFSEALVRVVALLRGLPSRVIFTVHDELVVDMHPDDEAAGLAERIVQEMQGTQFVVKAKKGRTYGDATR
jgi:hypothetical protein